MIIQRLDKCYEVIRQLSCASRMTEYLCQEQQEAYLLVRIAEPTLAKRFTLFLEEKIGGTEFPDYKGCFQADGVFYAVFTYSPERTLADRLVVGDCTKRERAEIARRLLEQMLLRSPHPYFMRYALSPDMITVSGSLEVAWNYHLEEVRTFDYCTMEAVEQRLSEVMKLLFEEELEGKRYPLLEDYLLALANGSISDYLEVYREFLPVYEELCGEEQAGSPSQPLPMRLWESCKRIGEKPDSLKGYFSIGTRYVAKKLAFLLVLLVLLPALLLPMLFFKLVYPFVESRFLTKTMVFHSEDTVGYTGKVRLVGDLEADNAIFIGALTEGRINGQGMLYDSEGNLRYRGDFLEDQYSGRGETYYQNGNVEYTGQFIAGQYEGMGKLYDEDNILIYEGNFSGGSYEGSGLLYQSGELIYEGDFSEGRYEGSGRLYYNGGVLAYEGSFAQGHYEGNGTLFYPDGNTRYSGSFFKGSFEGTGVMFHRNGVISYEGEFLQGQRSGRGKAYDERGELLYDGEFSQDRYEGEGILYENGEVLSQGSFHRDILTSGFSICYDEQREILYQGGIDNGLYDGEGKLYSGGRLLYDGTFEQGKYSGLGRLYDEETGQLLYEGSFYQGLYDGEGKRYDPVDGYLIYKGDFRKGKYNGHGSEYAEGILIYEGEFFMDAYNGKGTLYDQTTGAVVFEGVFKNNQFLDEPTGSEQEE